jgi:type VI protein secretion system component VasK
VPRGQERVEWMLLTTYKVDDAEAAIAVVQGYAQRWAIEEFHRTWKSGACNVESTQLRSVDAILRWATILASVAMRIQRLTKLARAQPDLDATMELTRGELDAIIQSNAKARRKYKPGDTPTLVEAVHWLAELGGYTGKSSGGPPGATVITRGLDRIQLLAELLDRTRPK